MSAMLTIEEHPLLDLGWLALEWAQPLGAIAASPEVAALLHADAAAPLNSSDEVRAAVRDLLRHGGFKPTGRSKPSSEYLLRAAGEGKLGAINPAVDVANAVSRHSGLPISVVDLDRAQPPLRVELAPAGARFVFNRSGQEIDVGGLLGLTDAEGPCANAVKDCQRTKTDESTTRTLVLVWGTRVLEGRTARAIDWLGELATELGAAITERA